MSEKEELIPVAMQIILHAGDARNHMNEALEIAKTGDFEKAGVEIKKAEEEIVLAHKSQTNIIQKEAAGAEYTVSLLFTHAQDTLMTINSELHLTKQMISILELLLNK